MSEIQDWIKQTVTQHEVVVFMKGTAEQPMCGFSRTAMSILKECGIEGMATVNVMESDEVRQGIKEYSNWPTIPQIFIKGEFIGGSDILTEMHKSGELQSMLSS